MLSQLNPNGPLMMPRGSFASHDYSGFSYALKGCKIEKKCSSQKYNKNNKRGKRVEGYV